MSARPFVYSLVFKADSTQARAAANEVKAAVAGVTAETTGAAAAADRDATAVQRETEARRRATEAARDQARAEKEAREAARRAIGDTVPVRTSPAPAAGSPSGPSSSLPPGPGPAPTPPGDLERLRAQYVPLFAAQQAYQKELDGIARAEAAGALTRGEAATALERLNRVHEKSVETIRRSDAALLGHGRTMRLQAHEARNLQMQMGDTFQTLALGMSPLQVLLQQGPQVVDAFGGIGNTFRFLRQELTATRVAMAGTAAAVLGGAYAWNEYLKASKGVELAVTGGGRSLGLTRADLERQALAASTTSGLSIPESLALGSQLAASGQIGGENIGGLIDISRDLEVTLGVERERIGEKLVEIFGKPAEGAQTLFARGLIDAGQMAQTQRLDAQNRRDEAQDFLRAAVQPNLADADMARTWIGRRWEGLGNLTDNVFYGNGAGIDRMTGGGRDDPRADLADKRRQLVRAQTGMTRSPLNAAALERQIADLEARIARQDAENQALRDDRLAGKGIDLAGRAAANTTALRERALGNEIRAMQESLAAPGLTPEQRGDITRAIEGQSAALNALTNRQELAIAMDRMEMQIATERNPMRRAELLGLQALMRAASEGLSVDDQLNASARARLATINEFIGAASAQTATMAEEAQVREELAGMVAAGTIAAADAATWMERELVLRPLIAAAGRAEGETKSELWGIIGRLEQAYDRLAGAKRREALAADGRASADRLADLRLETQLIGQSAEARIRARAAAEAERRIRDLGGDPNDADAQRRRAEAAAEAEAEIRRNRAQMARDLETDQILGGYDDRARLARNPIERSVIEAEREYQRVLLATGDAEEAAGRAALVRARALGELRGAAADLLRTQEDEIARLKLEAALAGASPVAKARAMADFDAEKEIRDMGLQAHDQMAEQIRRNARATADLRLETERLTEVWDRVRQSAEAAIDAPIDALMKGDFEGALEGLAAEITGLFSEIAIKNPLKNALLGMNLPTLQDAGGLKGIWAGLFGGDTALTAGAVGSVGAMTVHAAMVTLSGAGVADLFGGGTGGAAMGGAQAAWSGSLGGSAGVQNQVWNFFAGKGMAPHQIAAIMGNVAAESAFNPAAVGDGGTSFGLFQHHAGRAQGLLGAVGGQGGLGNIDAQLEYVWKELLTSESGVLKRLMASTDVRQATAAFVGFERPQGWSASDPTGAHNWVGRLGAAEAALATFGTTASTATQDLGTLGTGFDLFGNALAKGLQGAGTGGAQGGLTGFLGTLVGGLAKSLNIPGFAGGGDFPGGLRIVGERGPEIEATGPSRIFTASQTRDILTARAPVIAANAPGPTVVQLQPTLVNNTSRPMQMEVEETVDARGQRQQRYVLSDAVGEGLATPGGKAARRMADTYGVARPARRRS